MSNASSIYVLGLGLIPSGAKSARLPIRTQRGGQVDSTERSYLRSSWNHPPVSNVASISLWGYDDSDSSGEIMSLSHSGHSSSRNGSRRIMRKSSLVSCVPGIGTVPMTNQIRVSTAGSRAYQRPKLSVQNQSLGSSWRGSSSRSYSMETLFE
jgi:hypothetical protein